MKYYFKLNLFILSIIIGCDSSNNSTNLNEITGCTDVNACNYDSSATFNDGNCFYLDSCGECGGNIVSIEECPSVLNIYYDVSLPIGGFQFKIEGVTVTGAKGGMAEQSGFSTTTGNNTVLSFSFSGSIIPAGNGILVQLDYEGDISSACITNLILSDTNGNALSADIINCNTIKF